MPGLASIDARWPAEVQLARGVEANVRWSMAQILETPEGRARAAEGRLKLVGAVYALETGEVCLLP